MVTWCLLALSLLFDRISPLYAFWSMPIEESSLEVQFSVLRLVECLHLCKLHHLEVRLPVEVDSVWLGFQKRICLLLFAWSDRSLFSFFGFCFHWAVFSSVVHAFYVDSFSIDAMHVLVMGFLFLFSLLMFEFQNLNEDHFHSFREIQWGKFPLCICKVVLTEKSRMHYKKQNETSLNWQINE